jgi:hypothetical protein
MSKRRRENAMEAQEKSRCESSFEVDMSVVFAAGSVERDTHHGRSEWLRFPNFRNRMQQQRRERLSEHHIDTEAGRPHRSRNRKSGIASDSLSSGSFSAWIPNRTLVIAIMVGVVGFVGSTLFLGLGISAAVAEQETLFQIRALELVTSVETAWGDYESASRWIHQACALHPISRHDFSHIFEYLAAGVEVQVRSIII